ncbi:3-phosphoserine/phosphohydroxythreonine transaminase [Secundilactobacillus kimchicus]|nr:3-phosphoserine/phosphohydroxythreonine transaminase [Secundilactobacillus kimchicus]
MPIYNFSAGPAVMPKPVIEQIQRDLPNLNGSGMSILEISHRSSLFDTILAEAKQDLRDLMRIPDDYEILFFQGGGTGQFAAAPLNLATLHHAIALLDSGHWANRAGAEAAKLGVAVTTLASTQADHYTRLPHLPTTIPTESYDYLHLTVNNTIEGTTYHTIPQSSDLPLVADMSSNFLAQPYNVTDFDVIFAGAQKNLGPAGVTVVIIKKAIVKPVDHLPSMLDYHLFMTKNSLYNTPPVFAIYAAGLVLKWLKAQGGVAGIYQRNQEEAAKLYDFLDHSKLFYNPVHHADRSLTNIPFMTGDAQLDAEVVETAAQEGLMNLKGHRSVGGLRASFYNAMPMTGVDALVNFLHHFEQQR